MHQIINRSIAVAVLVMVSGLASAQKQEGEHRQPPAEALAACKALTSGAACSFTGPHRSVTGSCFAREGKPLACRPKGGERQRGKPDSSPAPKN
jgi:hypothetical protein